MVSFENKNSIQKIYDSCSEKELSDMWSDIVGKDIESLNRSLMKAIDENEKQKVESLKIGDDHIPLHSKEMWDSEKGSWVPFDLWGASFIVNHRKEYLCARIYLPCVIQPEYGRKLMGWYSLNTSYLNERLKEFHLSEEKRKNDLNKSFSGYQDFYEIFRQDRQEYKYEGRGNESTFHNLHIGG